MAKALGYTYIDSGAMYRAVTLKALRTAVPVTDVNEVARLAERIELAFGKGYEKTVIYLDGEDVSLAIRTPEIDHEISPVAANRLVREILVKKQQELGKDGGVVMDGRDIGTVVFPGAELKIFMIASVEERASRRLKELEQKGEHIQFEEVAEEIRRRDREDTQRSHGPLKKADDAVELDTTNLSIHQQVGIILQLAKSKITSPQEPF